MKTIVAVFLCVAFFSGAMCLSEEEKEAIHKECQAQTGVSEDVVIKAMNGEFVDDPKFKAHVACFAKKLGWLNDAGEIQRDTMRAKLISVIKDEAIVDQMMTKCVVERGSPEETAFEACKCMHAIKHNM